MSDERIYLDAQSIAPLPESERLPNVVRPLSAALLACSWIVSNYRQAGFTAHNTRNRLQQRMNQCRKAGLWDQKHYEYVAYLYRESILQVYGERVKFESQR